MGGVWAALIGLLDGLLEGRAPATWPALPALPQGPRVWFLCPDEMAVASLGGLVAQLSDENPDVSVAISGPGAPLPDPGEGASTLATAFDLVAPSVLVLVGSPLRPRAVRMASQRGIPVLGLSMRASAQSWMLSWPARFLARRHLDQFERFLCEDQTALDTLRKAGAPAERLVLGGLLADDIEVLTGNEAERESLAEILTSRPIWCAAALPMAELPAVLAAQRLAMQRSHRLMLAIVPSNSADGTAMRDAVEAEGLIAALRSEGDDPEDDVAVYIADLPGEMGLWLRLAPTSWIGGSLAGGTDLSPMTAAALGSAILHGPEVGGHATAYARLRAAGAARMVRTPEEIAGEVERLLAPDEAAAMAHAAWEVSSAGEDAVTRAVEVLQDILRHEAA